MSKKTIQLIFSSLIFLVCLSFSSLSLANSSSESYRLPMDSFNFQNFVADPKSRRGPEEPPNLIRLHVDPDLYWVVNKLIDGFQAQNNLPFRIHQGRGDDHSNLVDEGYVFDLVISASMAYPQELLVANKAKEIQVLAVGRLGLWAPLETVRSTRVVELQTGAIGLMTNTSVYHQAALDVLDSVDLLPEVEKRLQTMTVFQDLYAVIKAKEVPLGFLPWNRLVQEGIDKRKEVLKLDAKHHSALTHGIALTKAGSNREEVKEFWRFVFSPKGRAIMQTAGFD